MSANPGDRVPIRRALLSVWDKSGLAELGRALADRGVAILASGGTARALADAGLQVLPVEEVTGAAELLGGRVKTLHPAIHAAILARRDHPQDARELAAGGIEPIDLVVVNLYPFADAAALGAADPDGRTELIDIGGVALIRAAAKNWKRVAVLTDPADYAPLVEEIARGDGGIDEESRRRLAARAMRLTAWYDSRIAAWLSEGDAGWPERWTLGAELVAELRYGENPHQAAALYRDRAPHAGDLTAVQILQGKALSYNNYQDLEAARRLARDLEALDPSRAHCVIVKHTIPCGVAGAPNAGEAYRRALAADPVSAFGGVVALTRPIDADLGRALTETFLEVVWAPACEPAALEVLSRKKNLRVVTGPVPTVEGADWEIRRLAGGLLLQSPNLAWLPAGGRAEEVLPVATTVRPDAAQWPDILFAWTVCRSVASNAIVLARDRATVGIGGGQTNRVGALHLAVRTARELGHDTTGAVLASDGFFPFADSIEAAAAAGIAAIIQPGGSRRDDEVVAAAEAAGIPMVLSGMRQFRH